MKRTISIKIFRRRPSPKIADYALIIATKQGYSDTHLFPVASHGNNAMRLSKERGAALPLGFTRELIARVK
jgi:hypothetical protein